MSTVDSPASLRAALDSLAEEHASLVDRKNATREKRLGCARGSPEAARCTDEITKLGAQLEELTERTEHTTKLYGEAVRETARQDHEETLRQRDELKSTATRLADVLPTWLARLVPPAREANALLNSLGCAAWLLGWKGLNIDPLDLAAVARSSFAQDEQENPVQPTIGQCRAHLVAAEGKRVQLELSCAAHQRSVGDSQQKKEAYVRECMNYRLSPESSKLNLFDSTIQDAVKGLESAKKKLATFDESGTIEAARAARDGAWRTFRTHLASLELGHLLDGRTDVFERLGVTHLETEVKR